MIKFNKLFVVSALFFVLLGGCFYSSSKRSQELQKAVHSLSLEELAILDTFFRTLLSESQGGYALYGNKPCCLEGFANREEGSAYLAKWIHVYSTKLKEGALLWEKLNLNRFCKNHMLYVYEKPFREWRHFLLVNKQGLLHAIDANLPLFQYVLGPKVTPTDLLTQLSASKGNFDSVLHGDRVLIGILLGYGTQNALHGARTEDINEGLSTTPTFAFTTLNDESSWLKENEVVSIDFSEEKTLLLPWFGCYDSKETSTLIKGYKRTQKKISKVLKSKHFLAEVLSQFFEEKVTINSRDIKDECFSFPDKDEMTSIVAQSIWRCIEEKDPEYIDSFVKGMEASDLNVLPLSDSEYSDLVMKYFQRKEKSNPLDSTFLKMRMQIAYYAGMRVWNHLKLGKDLYSLPDIVNLLSEVKRGALAMLPVDSETDLILTHLHWVLYQRESQPLSNSFS
jgi:hypothetical protein